MQDMQGLYRQKQNDTGNSFYKPRLASGRSSQKALGAENNKDKQTPGKKAQAAPDWKTHAKQQKLANLSKPNLSAKKDQDG
jgi:hypothetical protein